MKPAIKYFLFSLLLPVAASAGGMISGEPAFIEKVRSCEAKSIDASFPIPTVKVVEFYEEALDRNIFRLLDENGGIVAQIEARDNAGSEAQEYTLFADVYATQPIGSVRFESSEGVLRTDDLKLEMLLENCQYSASTDW